MGMMTVIQVFLYLTAVISFVLCHPIHHGSRRGDNCNCNSNVDSIIGCCNDTVLHDIYLFKRIFTNFPAMILENQIVR